MPWGVIIGLSFLAGLLIGIFTTISIEHWFEVLKQPSDDLTDLNETYSSVRHALCEVIPFPERGNAGDTGRGARVDVWGAPASFDSLHSTLNSDEAPRNHG